LHAVMEMKGARHQIGKVTSAARLARKGTAWGQGIVIIRWKRAKLAYWPTADTPANLILPSRYG
jgi:hypothetical protein